MTDTQLLSRRFGQYAQAWLATFLLALIGTLGPRLLLGADLIRMADAVLTITFVAIAALYLAFFVVTVIARQPGSAKALLIVLGLVLLLPLFWAPVLGVVTAAWASDATIEYSRVYAGFRILVGNMLFDVTRVIFGNPLVEAGWAFFQGLATVVGVFSGVISIWRFLHPAPQPA